MAAGSELFRQRILELIREEAMTGNATGAQKRVAARTGIPESTISDVKHGKRTRVLLETMETAAQRLGKPLTWFYFDETRRDLPGHTHGDITPQPGKAGGSDVDTIEAHRLSARIAELEDQIVSHVATIHALLDKIHRASAALALNHHPLVDPHRTTSSRRRRAR